AIGKTCIDASAVGPNPVSGSRSSNIWPPMPTTNMRCSIAPLCGPISTAPAPKKSRREPSDRAFARRIEHQDPRPRRRPRPSHRELLRQTQTVPRHGHALRQDCPKFPRRHPPRRRNHLAQLTTRPSTLAQRLRLFGWVGIGVRELGLGAVGGEHPFDTSPCAIALPLPGGNP